jgi:uncharacterized protein with GYD domain
MTFFSCLGDTIRYSLEAPDDENVAKACLAETSKGNVHTETLRAFSEDEFQKMVEILP